ncbi:MAG TPA: helix-turn-helix domain-containing protein [bacterium]|jgi:hypothetical protein|nr:helix-turn-helix domain-containing protein [bacterium]
MGINIQRADTEDFRVTLIEQNYQEEPSIYDLRYLVYRLDLQKELNLNDMETKLLSFILSFNNVSDKFYFGNATLAKLFGKHINTISSTISSLEKKGLIECSRQIMAGGGEIRFIRPMKNYEQGTQKTVSKAHRKLGENNNKISINISKDMGKDTLVSPHNSLKEKKEYGNADINKFIKGLNKYLEIKLPEDGKARKIAKNSLDLFTKYRKDGSIKEGREFLYDDKWENVKWFLSEYMEKKVKKGFSAQSWETLYRNIKIWIANNGSLGDK